MSYYEFLASAGYQPAAQPAASRRYRAAWNQRDATDFSALPFFDLLRRRDRPEGEEERKLGGPSHWTAHLMG